MQENSLKTWVNGKEQATISVYDRGLMYGQSVFETIAVSQQKALLRESHLTRLKQGCETLGIHLDYAVLDDEINAALEFADYKSLLRVSVTMGEGGRGYKNPVPAMPTRLISLHDYPDFSVLNYTDGIEIGVADIRLAEQAELAGIKHSNRLEQIIARSQWQDHWQEALLLDSQQRVIEATHSNIFIVTEDVLKTPDLSMSGVAGVMREFVLSVAEDIGVSYQIVPLSITDIEQADEAFVSNSVIGLWPIKRFHQINTDTQYSDFTVAQQLLTIMQDHGAIPNI